MPEDAQLRSGGARSDDAGFGVLAYLATLDGNRPRIIVMTAAVPGLANLVPAEEVVGVLGKPFDLKALVDLAEEAFPMAR